ncbi:hypothetical protein CRYUN_Cryun41cG0072300 [Craigia yunnanensis]
MADAPEVVAKAFQEQYYDLLLESAKFVYRFYKDTSSVSWEGQDGVMRQTTMKGIFDYFLSFSDVENFDILSSDTQDSVAGLIVLVIGCMIFKNDKTRKFSQTFFLAPQENGGYFVLNDIFRFLDDEEAKTSNLLQSINHEPTLISSPQVVASAFVEKYYHHLRESPEFVHEFYKDSSWVSWRGQEGVMSNVTTLKGISDHFLSLSDAKKYDILSYDAQHSFGNGFFLVVIGCVTLENDKPKKFSQSFFLAPKENGGYFALNDVFIFLDDEKPLKIYAAENSDTSATEDSNLNRVNAFKETTIFVGNLSSEIDVKELTNAFKRFGTIKPNGVEIKKARYGFIEFESPTSAQAAVHASSIRIGYRYIRIEAWKRKN